MGRKKEKKNKADPGPRSIRQCNGKQQNGREMEEKKGTAVTTATQQLTLADLSYIIPTFHVPKYVADVMVTSGQQRPSPILSALLLVTVV